MNGIFTKAWWENKKFLIRLLAFGPMFAAVFAAAIPAMRFNAETNNWFAAWTFAHVASAAGFGNAVNVPKRELPVKADAFLDVVCTGNARICQLYDQQSAKFFGIYPVIAAGATLVILLLVAGLGFKKKSDEDHRRGSVIADAKDLTKLLKKEGSRPAKAFSTPLAKSAFMPKPSNAYAGLVKQASARAPVKTAVDFFILPPVIYLSFFEIVASKD